MKKIIVPIIIVLTIFGLFKLTSKNPVNRGFPDNQSDLILFWGDGCPHCKIVDEYILKNNVDDKVKITYKEVYYNKTNQNLLAEVVKKCPEIDSTNGVGVPLAFVKSESRCLYGDTPIIDYLKAQMLK